MIHAFELLKLLIQNPPNFIVCEDGKDEFVVLSEKNEGLFIK